MNQRSSLYWLLLMLSPSEMPKSNGFLACSALIVCTAASSTWVVATMLGDHPAPRWGAAPYAALQSP